MMLSICIDYISYVDEDVHPTTAQAPSSDESALQTVLKHIVHSEPMTLDRLLGLLYTPAAVTESAEEFNDPWQIERYAALLQGKNKAGATPV